MKALRHYCKDCEAASYVHIATWLDDLMERILPDIPHFRVADAIGNLFIRVLEKIFTAAGIARYVKDPPPEDLPARLGFFVRALKEQGYAADVLKGPLGYTYNLRVSKNGKIRYMEGFPLHAPGETAAFPLDDKEKTKEHLKKAGFPVPEGRSFWFWQKGKARRYANSIGYPVVVKPRGGSVARHVTTDIRSDQKLADGIVSAVSYAPTFIVEKYLAKGFVHRATVVDFEKTFCARQVPAHVVGNGASSVAELAANENEKRRSLANGLTHEIDLGEGARKYLHASGASLEYIPAKGETVYLHKDPFVRLGGTIEELTGSVHPDNSALFCAIARAANARVVGMDVMLEDVSMPWKDQQCAVLELNSLPCIEMHQDPTCGTPGDVAKDMVNMINKYYD